MSRPGAQVRAAVGCCLFALLFVACVAPAYNESQYRSKVAKTAGDAVSVLETVRLAIEESDRHTLPTNPIDVGISGQEDILDSVTGTFSSVQPPDAEMQELRGELLGLLQRAQDKVESARIAYRNNDVSEALSVIESVEPISKQIEDIGNRF